MPNLNQILREEIVRLAKREINQQVKPLKGQLVELRKTVREQRHRIDQLQREGEVPILGACRSTQPEEDFVL